MISERYLKAGALLAVAALSLSACGGDDPATPATPDAPGTEPAAPAPADPTTPADETEPADEPGDAVQIEYIHRLPDKEGMVLVKDIVDRWNQENPNIQVTATKWDGEAADLRVKLEADVKAGTAPCLAQTGYSEVPELFVKDVLMDVTAEAEKYKDNFGGAYGQMTLGGVTVGLPQDSGPLIYMYNEAAFQELGIEVPTTLEEFTEAAKTAAAAEGGKYIAAFTPDEAWHWLSAQSAAAGGVWYSAESDAWKVDADSEASKVVADFWQGLLDANAVVVADRWGPDFEKALTDGSLIGHIAAAWEVGFALDVLDGTEFEGQWRVAQLPDFGKGAMTGPDGGSGVSVLKGCEHPAEAMEFNNWFNTQVDDLTSQGLVTAAAAPANQPEKWTTQFGGQDVVAELVKANEALNPDFAYAPGWSALQDAMNTAAANASKDGQVADVFKAAQDASVAALKDAGLPVANG